MRQLLLYINFNGFQPTPCFSHVKKTHTFLYACIHIMLFIRILYTSQNLINFVITKFGGVWAASTLGAPVRNCNQILKIDLFQLIITFFSSGLGVSAIFTRAKLLIKILLSSYFSEKKTPNFRLFNASMGVGVTMSSTAYKELC